MQEVVDAIIGCSEPYEIYCGGRTLRPVGFYRAPLSPATQLDAVAGIPEEQILASGLFYANPLDPVIGSKGVFLVLRNQARQILDVIYEPVLWGASYAGCRCASGRFPLIRLFADVTFNNNCHGDGRVCLVNSLGEAALLRLAGVRACPGSCLVTADAGQLDRVGQTFRLSTSETGRGANKPALAIGEWRIDENVLEAPAFFQDLLLVLDRLEARTQNLPDAVQLWRPERRVLHEIDRAHSVNHDWWVAAIQKSYLENRRSIRERDRPLEGDPRMLSYALEELEQISLWPNPVAIGPAWHSARAQYMEVVWQQLSKDQLYAAASSATDSAQLTKSALDKMAMLGAIPEFILEMSKRQATDPTQARQLFGSGHVRRLQEAADAAAKSEMALRAGRNGRRP